MTGCRLTAILLATLLAVANAQAQPEPGQELAEAKSIYRQQGPAAALPLFERLAAEAESGGNSRQLARATGYIGEIHWRLGDFSAAAEYLGQALTQHRAAGDRLQEGKILNVLGLLHWDMGQLEQAQSHFRQGSKIAEEVGDRRLAGAILNNLSLVHDEQGDYLVSLQQYRRVLELYEGQDFARGEGDTLGNMGGVYLLLGRYQQALDHYRQALEISEQLDSTISLSQDHGNLALAYLGLGNVDLALQHLDRAIALAESAGMQQDIAYWMRHRGNALILEGRHGEGLESHRAALDLYDQLDGRTERIEALHDMGRLYQALGDLAGAERYYRQSMELAQEVGVSRAITDNLLALGYLQALRGDFDAASKSYRSALERARESGEMALWSRGLILLAESLNEQEKSAAARQAAQQAFDIAQETGAVALQARALFTQAQLHRQKAESEQALDRYRQSLSLLEAAPDAELEWRVHYGIGLVLASRGELLAAIESLLTSVRLIEGVRDRLEQERFRAGYVQDKYQVYTDLVRLQLEAGHKDAAFISAERLRSRSYLDLVKNRLPAADEPGDQLEFALKERILTLRRALADEQNMAQPDQRQTAIRIYNAELLEAQQDYQAFLDERGRASPRHGIERVPSYAEVGARLAADEALLEYVVGPERVMLFLLTRDRLNTRVIPLRREDLDNKVELVRKLISRRDDERWQKPAASLSAALLSTLGTAEIMENIRHIYLVPHGTLNYLPFALLPLGGDAGERVIERYTLAYLPTAAALFEARQGGVEPGGLLAMAPERSRLLHAGAEARAIGEMFNDESTALVGAAATESAFKQEAARYRMLHLATHGYFNKFNPMLSGLELESDEINDGQLELHEILGLELQADLVTLSACETALGSGHFAEIPAGDDFVGLTRAFLYAGSTSVMATLWEVDDASTLELMTLFYGGLTESASNEDKAAALASAQRALLSSKKYRHPYYWAPFVLVGEMSRGREKRS
jgi:CHAT domain-containing protein/Tfp pilus assembly protein PilF